MSAYYQYFTIVINIIIGLTAICLSAILIGMFLFGIYLLSEMRKK